MKKDDHLDEKIIKMIDQVETPEATTVPATDIKTETPPEERTIYTGIKIDGKWIEFAPRLFVEDKISMMVPKEFKDLDLEIAKIKYPMEQRPQTILTDYTGTVNIIFNYMDEKIANNDIEMIRDRLLAMIQRMNPGIKPQSTGKEEIEDKTIAYVEFSNTALDGKLYNLMYFLEVDGKALVGSLNCLTKSMKYWKKPAFEMMQSIKILEPERN